MVTICSIAGGLEALGREIAMDVGRLSYRNLGRDDRVVADHGKDGRYPFLDEEVSVSQSLCGDSFCAVSRLCLVIETDLFAPTFATLDRSLIS